MSSDVYNFHIPRNQATPEAGTSEASYLGYVEKEKKSFFQMKVNIAFYLEIKSLYSREREAQNL